MNKSRPKTKPLGNKTSSSSSLHKSKPKLVKKVGAVKKAAKRSIQTESKRSFSGGAPIPEFGFPVNSVDESVPFDGNTPNVAKRKSIHWNMRNPHKDDEMVEEDRETINKFLEPIGLGQYKDKFTSFDQVLMTKTGILKQEFGMSCKERKMLRKHSNYYRVGLFYKTGEIYQPKYQFRQPINGTRHHFDDTSEDDISFALPAKDGLYRAYIRYPGSSYRENHRAGTYNDARMIINKSKNAKLTPEQQEQAATFFKNAEAYVPEWVGPRGNGAMAPTSDSENYHAI